jgi:hypothetical protein
VSSLKLTASDGGGENSCSIGGGNVGDGYNLKKNTASIDILKSTRREIVLECGLHDGKVMPAG